MFKDSILGFQIFVKRNIDFADIFFLDIFSDKVYDNIENTNIFVLRGFYDAIKADKKRAWY